jgi:hypothetical protein
MRRIITKEILVEIETIRLTKKRSVRQKPPEQAKTDAPNCADCPANNNARLEQLFHKFYGEF